MIDKLRQNERLWDLFSRAEEYNPEFKDKYKRFASIQSNNGRPFEPVVSRFLVGNGLKAGYPDEKKFAVCLTHDIDIVNYSGLKIPYEAALSLIKGKVSRSLKIIVNKFSRKLNPIWNFDKILSLEKKYGANSSFYFLSLEKGDTDFNFKPDNLKDIFQEITNSGSEVGLHGGHEAYNNYDTLKREKDRLENAAGKEITGYRNHYLRFEVPATWEILSRAGLKHDATFGYADCVGFRNGMCHPYRPFNRNTDEFIDILEIPLIVMDCTFDLYMRFDIDEAWQLTRQLIDRTAELNGVITFLWHNTYFLDEQYEFYEKILLYCRDKNAWMSSGEKICDWWNSQNFIKY